MRNLNRRSTPGVKSGRVQKKNEILEQMPTVDHVPGLGGTLASRVAVGCGAIAADDLTTGMGLEPLCQWLRLPIGQQVDHPVAFQVDQDRAVALPRAEGSVIHTKHSGWCGLGQRQGPDQSQKRRAARRSVQDLAQALARAATQCQGNLL